MKFDDMVVLDVPIDKDNGHTLLIHEEMKLHVCHICDKNFTQKVFLMQHIEKVHEGKI